MFDIFFALPINYLYIVSATHKTKCHAAAFIAKAALLLCSLLHNTETFIEFCLMFQNVFINIYFSFRWLSLTEWITIFSYDMHSTHNQISKIFQFHIKIKTKVVIICLKILVKMNFLRSVIWLVNVQTFYCLHSWDLIQLT